MKTISELPERVSKYQPRTCESKQVLHKTEIISREAMKLRNQNEQYSRKHNYFKIVGSYQNEVTEKDENMHGN